MRPSNIGKRGIAAAACVLALGLARRNAGAEPPLPSSELDDAPAIHRASQTATTVRARELAQFRLAISLYRLKFFQSAYGIFSEIADHPNHAAFHATLPWLAKLATDLPEPADIDERVGKYNELAIDMVHASEPALGWQLDYLLGRYRYRNRQYEGALRLFARVDRLSKYYCKAQFWSGIANVQMRRPVEAVKSFEKIVQAIDDGIDGLEDDGRLQALARLSIARTYYSAAVRLDGRGVPVMNRSGLAAALAEWKAVDVTSEYWLDAIFEQSWAYFMVGDHARALGNLHTIQLIDFQKAYSPEVDILRSTIYVTNCQYDDAATLAARFHAKYQPIATELTTALTALQGADQDEPFYKFARDVREGRGSVSAQSRPAVTLALGDRQFLRHLQYVVVLEDELKRLAKAPPAFRDSALGSHVKDAAQLARDIAIRNAAELARDRLKRQLEELNEHLRDNVKLLVGAMAGQRGGLDPSLVPWRVPARDADRNVVRADEEHVIWPFTGELWSDEGGSYRQSIRSKCR